MSDNPQEFTAPPATEPKEPGEIGWPADASAPGDPSVPEPGSGGAGPYEPGTAAQPVHAGDLPADAPVEVSAAELPPDTELADGTTAGEMAPSESVEAYAGEVNPDAAVVVEATDEVDPTNTYTATEYDQA